MSMLRRITPFNVCTRAFAVLLLAGAPLAPVFAQQEAPAESSGAGAPVLSAPAPVVTPAPAAPVTTTPDSAPAAGTPAAGIAETEPLVPAMPGSTDTTATTTEPTAVPAASGEAAPAAAGTEAPAAPLADPLAEGVEDASISAQLPHDLSPWGMFMAADIVVKAVMIGLAFASVVTWTVWLVKTLELAVAVRRLRTALAGYLASPSLEAARTVGAGGPAGAMLKVTDLELKRSGDLPAEGIKERVSISLNRIEVAAGRSITRGTGLLATIGSTAPFVGLFGTVWGIMNSFIGISKAQTTNLAIVAPGIAEALLATAIGLVAAIPAVVIYNHFSRQVSGYRVLMGDASAEVLRLLSRDLDRRDATRAQPVVRLRAAAE